MRQERVLAEARLKSLRAEVLRGLSLAATRRAEEIRDETRATRAAIRQRRLLDARRRARAFRITPERTPTPH
jgi:hypothetical protein